MNQNIGQNKKGISPFVIILFVIALLAVTVLIITLGAKKQQNADHPSNATEETSSTPPQTQDLTTDPLTQITTPSDITPPNDDASVKLSVQNKKYYLNSGGEVSYGYPSLTIQDTPKVASRINEMLTTLVDERIVPIAKQMAAEDTPNATRIYSFSLCQGSGFYSIVVTVDINEGLTSARETYGWNFLANTGEFVERTTHCNNQERLAAAIDGCIENIASYDQIIHQWLIDVVTDEYENTEFSFYFENENMIAVLNKRLRLNSYDRDPILITVPYTKIADIFTKASKE